jgi:hypothetical protein
MIKPDKDLVLKIQNCSAYNYSLNNKNYTLRSTRIINNLNYKIKSIIMDFYQIMLNIKV